MADVPAETGRMRPQFENVQAHYDLSDDFFGLFLDPTRTCQRYFADEMLDVSLVSYLKPGVAG